MSVIDVGKKKNHNLTLPIQYHKKEITSLD